MDIGLTGAFIGGVLTLLSPCSVMLLPAFFSYAFQSPTQLVSRVGVFYLGLITTLVPMGILAGSFGAFVTEHRFTVVAVASWIVIALGALMISGAPIPTFSAVTGRADSTSVVSVWALGTVYGIAGVCAGPLLGAVLTLAALGGNAAYGGIVLLIFAVGMVTPLLLLTVLWDRLPAVRRLVRPRTVRIGRWTNTWTNIVSGVITIGIGILLLRTNGTASLGGVLDIQQQAQIENWALRSTRDIPDFVFVLVAFVIVGAVWQIRRRIDSNRTNSKRDNTRTDLAEAKPRA